MEIIIIGGIAAGMSTAAKARRVNREANITVIEKEDFISFGACGLPYYLGGQFTDANNMFARTPQQMEDSGINLLLKHEVEAIDFDAKSVTVKNLVTGDIQHKKYDKLMIATGATPVIPPMEGVKSDNVYTITKLVDTERLKNNLNKYKTIGIIGGGFIGIEVAEQLNHLGVRVELIERSEHVMNKPFDSEFSIKIEEALEEKGIHIHRQESVDQLVVKDNQVTAIKTTTKNIPVDALIMAIGFKPNTAFITDERLTKLPNGAIVIDKYGQTSIPDVFSAGDCATVWHRQLGDVYLPLATSANKIGRLIGNNIVVDPDKYEAYSGSLGSSSIKVGDYEAGSTGLTEAVAKQQGLDYKTTCIETNNHTNYWPNQTKITIKLVYDAQTKVILGAQVFGKSDAVLRMTGLTTAIYAGLTTTEIGFIDYAYAPPFASTWEALNVAANTAK